MTSGPKHIESYFNPESGHILLKLDKEEVGLADQFIEYDGKSFQPKDEVHITVVGSKLAAELADVLAENAGLEEEVNQLIAETEWSYSLLDEWYHIRREEGDTEADSIIQMTEVPWLKNFYRRLEEATGLEIPQCPTHVTLYVWNDPEGIGVATFEQFRELVVSELEPEMLEE